MAVLKMSDSLLQFTRKSRHISDKIIFISCEGGVTEEEYFGLICELFSDIKSKIQIISVREDLLRVFYALAHIHSTNILLTTNNVESQVLPVFRT